MTQEQIIKIADKSGALKEKDGVYIFMRDELLWFVNELSTQQHLASIPNAGDGWQDIATAPKDGNTMVDLVLERVDGARERHINATYNFGKWAHDGNPIENKYWKAIYWMPVPSLPAPPSK